MHQPLCTDRQRKQTMWLVPKSIDKVPDPQPRYAHTIAPNGNYWVRPQLEVLLQNWCSGYLKVRDLDHCKSQTQIRNTIIIWICFFISPAVNRILCDTLSIHWERSTIGLHLFLQFGCLKKASGSFSSAINRHLSVQFRSRSNDLANNRNGQNAPNFVQLFRVCCVGLIKLWSKQVKLEYNLHYREWEKERKQEKAWVQRVHHERVHDLQAVWCAPDSHSVWRTSEDHLSGPDSGQFDI